MDNNKLLIAIIIIIVVVIGAVSAVFLIGDGSDDSNSTNSTNSTNITNITNNTTVDTSGVSSSQNSASGDSSNGPSVVSESVEYNYQNGGGYYRQVEYSDGNFRQYDVNTGELIGSSFESDQKYLPSME